MRKRRQGSLPDKVIVPFKIHDSILSKMIHDFMTNLQGVAKIWPNALMLNRVRTKSNSFSGTSKPEENACNAEFFKGLKCVFNVLGSFDPPLLH